MPPHPFDKRWHVHIDEKTYGPYTGHEIRRLMGEGKIVEFDFVYSEGGSQWVQAQNDPILGKLFIKPDTKPFQSPPPSQIKFLQRHWVKILIGALAVIVIGWIAWPYYAIYDLMNGVRDGDVAVLENRVAWDSVRQALRGDLNAFLLETLKPDAGAKDSGATLSSGLATLFGPAVINQMIDAYVTPQAVAAINRTKNSTSATGVDSPSSNSGQAVSSTAIRRLDWDQVRYAFFSGGPFTFRVDLMPKVDPPPQHPTTLIFKWAGTWQLTRIALPEDMFDRIKQTNTLSSQLDKGVQPNSSSGADVSSNLNTPPKTDTEKARTQAAEPDKKDEALLKAKQDYITNLEIYDFKAHYYKSFLDERTPGVEFKIKNNGAETLDEVKVTVYFKDAKGNTIAEENYYPVLKSNFLSEGKPLKPNYIWQMERGKFYTAKSVPSEWKEGAAEIRITDLQFEGELTLAEKQKLGSTPVRSAPPQTGESTLAETDRPIAVPPTLPATARAKLYEEEPNNPYGRSYDGSVTWRTETVAAGQLSIRADITIPERQMKVVWTLRRNTDPALPASHTIEIIFNRDIGQVPGMLMKASEQARGTPLAGHGVKVKQASFSFGLSPDEAQHNVELLKDEPWLDIPFVYSNGHRAIMAVEKGETGNRLLAQAFLSWGQ